jgi:hypothetical protein
MPNTTNELKPNSQSDLDIPEDYHKWPDAYRPKRVKNNRLQFPSPFAKYPGHVILPIHLSASEYQEWWEQSSQNQDEDDNRHWSLWTWETRFHLLKSWHFENIESSLFVKNPIGLPDQRLLIWFTVITQPIINNATHLPNWPEPSSDT